MAKANLKVKIQVRGEPVECTRSAAKALRAIEAYDPRTIEVLGVPFGGHIEGRDSYGEAFTPDTGIGMRIGNSVPVTYYHGFSDDGEGYQDPPALLGEATYTRQDTAGHWFDVRLDAGDPYSQRIFETLDNGGDVKASSGAVAHLVRYGDAGLITTWVVGELAIFDTNDIRQPANQLAVVGYKADGEKPYSGAQQGGKPKATQDADDIEAIDVEMSETNEEYIQTDEIKKAMEIEPVKTKIPEGNA